VLALIFAVTDIYFGCSACRVAFNKNKVFERKKELLTAPSIGYRAIC
jgi:hypothetical protein